MLSLGTVSNMMVASYIATRLLGIEVVVDVSGEEGNSATNHAS